LEITKIRKKKNPYLRMSLVHCAAGSSPSAPSKFFIVNHRQAFPSFLSLVNFQCLKITVNLKRISKLEFELVRPVRQVSSINGPYINVIKCL